MFLFCRELVSHLQERNVQVFLISGGFRSIVEHVASKLNIPSTNVFANRLKFYFNGKTFHYPRQCLLECNVSKEASELNTEIKTSLE